MEKIRNEYPRPDFVRERWLSLNGRWDFAFDDEDQGHSAHWERGFTPTHSINVPFAFQTELSGIGDTTFHDRMWYQHTIADPRLDDGSRVLLHLEGVDYWAEVYVNGYLAVTHRGSSTRFSADITDLLVAGENRLTVFAYDPSRQTDIPRGKQYWHERSTGIWYNRTSGIWKSVWLEQVNPAHIERAIIRPDIDRGTVGVELKVSRVTPFAKAVLRDREGRVVSTVVTSLSADLPHTLQLRAFGLPGVEEPHCWTPEDPYLYGLTLSLLDERMEVLDTVETYVGMRSVETRDGMVYLNHKPYFQKLVLDQGYWPQSLLTAPDVEALENDIRMAKAMGFNGCRKHQKVEDPWFYYLADKLGYLVWADCLSPASFSEDLIGRITNEFREEVEQYINHPSIIAWVPFNESWGVPQIGFDAQQQALASSLYFQAKALDPTRLAISNDGWEHTFSDLVTIHNYMHGAQADGAMAKDFAETLSSRELCVAEEPAAKRIFAEGFGYTGQPIVISEFGGVAYEPSFGKTEEGSWGYTKASDEDGYLADLARIFGNIGSNRVVCGYCYTQLTDVEQEQNGLLTYDRRFKVDAEKIKKINDSIAILPIRKEAN